jgi:hypothetical protein
MFNNLEAPEGPKIPDFLNNPGYDGFSEMHDKNR